jgi:hypothetical protein
MGRMPIVTDCRLPEVAAGQDFTEIPLDIPGLRAVLSLRSAGDMRHSLEGPNPARWGLFRRLGLDSGRVHSCRQVHSRTVAIVRDGRPADSAALQADGLVTGRPEVWLAVTVADCLPVWLADRRGAAFAMLHSGWRGTGIARQAVRLLREQFGASPEDLLAVIGPGIGPCCYHVPADRYRAFLAEHGPRAALEREGRYRLDLREANRQILEDAGVGEIRIYRDCTCCRPFLSSFRRDGPEGMRLMLAMIGRELPAARRET